MAEEGCVEIGEANTGCKMEDTTSSLGAAPVVCLVCDCVIKELHRQDVPNVFLESSVTSHSQQQLANMLSVIIKSPLESSQVYSKTLCRRCFRLLDELDGIEQRSVVLKTTIEELYNRSLLRRMKGPRVNDEETIGAMDLGLPEDDEEDDGSKISVKVEPLDDDDDFLADELRPEDQGIRPDDPEFNPAHDNTWRSKSRSKGRGRGRGRSRGRARGRGRGRGPGRPPKNIKDEEAAASKAGESLGEKLGQLVNKILGDDESEEPVDMETETPTTSVEEVEEEVDATEKITVDEGVSLSAMEREGGKVRTRRKSTRIEKLLVKTTKMTYKNKTHVCDLCGLEFEYAQEYRDHTKTHGSYECVMCGKVIAKRGMLTQHYAKFHGLKLRPDSQHFCWICGKKYKSKPAVAYHITTAHSNEKLKCNKCDKTFGHVKNLKAHMKRHGDKNVACDKCPARFFTTSELGYHYNAVHQNARCWKCEICGTEFNRSSIYINHMEKHKSKRFECTVCFKMFHRKAHIEAHMKQHANPTDPDPGLAGKTKIKKYFRCNECSALFESEEIKRDHLCGDRVRVIRRYMCDRCNFSFQCKEDLEAHTCSQNSSHILVQPENIAEDVQIYAEAGNLEPGSIGINTDEWETCFVVLSENGATETTELVL
ncbi:zinc finger protein 320-like isoform X4 [Penaeus monodon]|uniref:zinc finger protein 320-like isoform X4 n=1 Tax=Penaeus monodon TaxID=6687 RepID=UPI0018A7AF04|nr:zinc finger protein 320-like isoform X4 [Penaeus monodon]